MQHQSRLVLGWVTGAQARLLPCEEVNVNVNVNVHVYSPDIPVGSADCTIYTPGIGTHSFTVSSPLGRIQHLRTLLQL